MQRAQQLNRAEECDSETYEPWWHLLHKSGIFRALSLLRPFQQYHIAEPDIKRVIPFSKGLLAMGDEVKGDQRGEDDYIILEDDELENVALDSTKTIDISTLSSR
jgi:hypothetical protein